MPNINLTKAAAEMRAFAAFDLRHPVHVMSPPHIVFAEHFFPLEMTLFYESLVLSDDESFNAFCRSEW